MCVIIFIPKGETITEEEIRQAWATNPDGAGYAIRTTQNGEQVVKYHRGFMSCTNFYDTIKDQIGTEDIVLHFRISTSSRINQVQTHPYDKGNITSLYGFTTRPVIAMNGVISGQACYKGFNDTMSYITDNNQAFRIISETESEQLLDIIEDATGSKWAIITPDNVLLSKGFIYRDGRYYSNINHLQFRTYLTDYYYDNLSEKPALKTILPKKLYNQVKQDKNLYLDCLDYVNCFYDIPYLIGQLEKATTKKQLRKILTLY